MSKYTIATFIVCSVEGFVCYLIGYMVGITHDKRTITHECVKDTHDKTEPSDSENPNNCETCRFDDKYGDESICSDCSRHYSDCYEPKTEPTISKMEQVETMSCQECKWWSDLYQRCCQTHIGNECKYEPKDEPQTDCAWGRGEEK